MSIKIKHNETPHLKTTKMLCDVPLHDKLSKFPVLSFFNSHSTNMLIGKPKSGKTSLLTSLFMSKPALRGVYHNIITFMPNASSQSMSHNCFDEVPEEHQFNELNVENLEQVRSFLEMEDKNYNNCIIFDDMGAYLKNGDTLKALKEIVMNRRHLRCSIFFLCQTYYSAPREIRKLFSNLIIFRVSKPELLTIFEEQIEWLHKDKSSEISKLVFDKPYSWLFLNTDSQRMFKMWDEIICGDTP